MSKSKFVINKLAKIFEQGIISYKDLSSEILNILRSKRDEIVFKMKITSKEETEILNKRVDNLEAKIKKLEKAGFKNFPVCVAKTQYSFSTDPKLKGAPKDHIIPIREVRLSSGAEFIVVVCGSIMTMPGLPRVPAADSIKLNKDGDIEGLF